MAAFFLLVFSAAADPPAPEPPPVDVLAARPGGAQQRGTGRSADYPRPQAAEHSGCWDEQMEGSFLQTQTATGMKPQVDSDKWKQDYNWFANDKVNQAGKSPNRWAEVPKLGLTGAESQPAHPEWANAFPGKGMDFSLWGPLLGSMPSFAGALFGRSLFSGCKCEACVYSIDTMIMYLDEDTMGMFDESDIDRVLMDRFCYGIKWMYRSACHHIMSNYYEDVTDMVMTYYTGWDICRQLRFCPWFLNDPLNTGQAVGTNPATQLMPPFGGGI